MSDLAGWVPGSSQPLAHQLGDAFTLKRWFEEVHSAGIIPVSLIRWQLTGKDEGIRAIVTKE